MSDNPTKPKRMLSADIFCDVTGKKWTAIIREHPAEGGEGTIAWKRENMRTQNNAEMAMEAAYGKLELQP